MTNHSALPESKLLAAAKSGSEDAFAELVRRHSTNIYGLSVKMLKNREDAEDNLQNVLFKVYNNLRRFEEQSQFSTWLYRITVNEALMKLRKQQSERLAGFADTPQPQDENALLPEIQDTRQNQEREYISRELVSKLLQGLSPVLANTFLLHKTEGWTNRELADAQGVSVETVKSRLFRSRTRLREKLQALSQTSSVAFQG